MVKKCLYGKENCEICVEPEPYLKSEWRHFKEAVFVENSIAVLLILFLCIIFTGLWGVLWWLLILWCFDLGRGGVVGMRESEHQKSTGCIMGRENCEICHNKRLL